MAKNNDEKLSDILSRLEGKNLKNKHHVLTTKEKIIRSKKLRDIKKNWITQDNDSKNPKKILKKQKEFMEKLLEQQELINKKRSFEKPNKRKLLDRYKSKKGKKGNIDKVKRIDW